MATPTIVLTMIVKDEARVIARCLASVKPYITSWAIVDTGSQDGTQEIIRRELAGIPGELAELPWKGFAGSRNDALDLARKTGAVYAITLDADEELAWPEKAVMAPKLVDDLYGIRFKHAGGGEMTWQRAFLFKLSLPWRWVGDIHEQLDCKPVEPVKTLITGAHVISHNDGGRSRPRRHSIFDHLPEGTKIATPTRKFYKDAQVLEGLAEANPNEPRHVFYLAQSYVLANEIDKALETFKRRIDMGCGGWWDEEVYFSLFQSAGLMEARGDDWREVAKMHQAAYEARPTRAEPLWALAVMHNDRGMPVMAELYARAAAALPRPNDSLLVIESVYQYRAKDELAGALGRLGRYDEALAVLEELVKLPKLPDPERLRAEENIQVIRGMKTPPAQAPQAAA